MLASLTCRLLIASRRAWRQLTDADVESCLPSPAFHGAAIGGLTVGLAVIATYCHIHHDFGRIVRCILAAVSGSIGATALPLCVVPRVLDQRGVSHARAARYAAAATLPSAAAGLALQLPTLLTSFTAIALLGALAYRSGSLGADVFLGLAKAERTRIALLTASVSTLPALLAAPLCPAR